MDKNTLAVLIEQIRETEQIPVTAIPDIELYMDQLLTFLNQRLDTPNTNSDSPIFTKTMINNYTKDRLLIPPQNKKYSKQHIMLLILVYHLKGILPINDIKHLFEPILRDISTPDDDLLPLEDIYTTYLELNEKFLEDFSADFAKKLTFINDKTAHLDVEANNNVAQLFLTVLVLVAQASLAKKMAARIITNYFTLLPSK